MRRFMPTRRALGGADGGAEARVGAAAADVGDRGVDLGIARLGGSSPAAPPRPSACRSGSSRTAAPGARPRRVCNGCGASARAERLDRDDAACPAPARSAATHERTASPSTCTVQAPQAADAAAELGAGQVEHVAQRPQQRQRRIGEVVRKRARRAVDEDLHRLFAGKGSRLWRQRRSRLRRRATTATISARMRPGALAARLRPSLSPGSRDVPNGSTDLRCRHAAAARPVLQRRRGERPVAVLYGLIDASAQQRQAGRRRHAIDAARQTATCSAASSAFAAPTTSAAACARCFKPRVVPARRHRRRRSQRRRRASCARGERRPLGRVRHDRPRTHRRRRSAWRRSTSILSANRAAFSPSTRQYFGSHGVMLGDTPLEQLDHRTATTPASSSLRVNVDRPARRTDAGAPQPATTAAAAPAYITGPFAATLVVRAGQEQLRSRCRPASSARTRLQLGATYDFKFLRVYGQVGRVKTEADTDDRRRSSYQLGCGHAARQQPGPGGLRPLTHARRRWWRRPTRSRSIGYDYFLSKNTDIYVAAMYEKLSFVSIGQLVRRRHPPPLLDRPGISRG